MSRPTQYAGLYSKSLKRSHPEFARRRKPAERWTELYYESEELQKTFPTFRNFIYFVSIKAVDMHTPIEEIIKQKKKYDRKKKTKKLITAGNILPL